MNYHFVKGIDEHLRHLFEAFLELSLKADDLASARDYLLHFVP